MRPTAGEVSFPRRAALQLLPALAAVTLPSQSVAIVTDPFSGGPGKARYILMRPGETSFEAASMVDSNPINKQQSERGLTARGRAQVTRSIEALTQMGITSPQIFYDSGVRATETAEMIAVGLGTPRKDVEPEFRWLEARGLGALDGTDLGEATKRLRIMDALDIDNSPETTDDGTPSDSINEVYSRLRNTVLKIENTYGGGKYVFQVSAQPILHR